MKVLCPECNVSVAVADGVRIFECPSCRLRANLSEIGTSPGIAAGVLTRDLSGEVFGGYRLESLIGMGGMGIVYKARRQSDAAVVALKILSCESVWKRDAFVKRFEREIRALSRLEHPNIVRFLDSGVEGDDHFLVTEFVPGENLAERLKRGPLTSDEIIQVMTGVLDALAYAHRSGIIHRDIKPANIIISEAGVKVLDFGLAQISSSETALTTLTRTNLAMGTFNYLSPEQRTSAKSVDGRSDLFSLGVVLFEMLTGTLPMGNFQLPSRVRETVDKRFDAVVSRSLAADPDARFPSAESFSGALVKLKERRRPYSVMVAAALVSVVLGAIGAFAFVGGGERPRDTVEVTAGVKRTPPTPPPQQKTPASESEKTSKSSAAVDVQNTATINVDAASLAQSAVTLPATPLVKTVEPTRPKRAAKSRQKKIDMKRVKQKAAVKSKSTTKSKPSNILSDGKASSLGLETNNTSVQKKKSSAAKKKMSKKEMLNSMK